MVKIITDYGYCFGVESAISDLNKAGESKKHVFLTHPLLHNLPENKRLMEKANASFLEKDTPYSEDNLIVLSAHGHSFEEEEEAKKHGRVKDATCPLIKRRYERIPKQEPGISYIYLGKENHQETIGFVSHFPYFTLVSTKKPLLEQLDALKLESKSVFVPQTTVGEESYQFVYSYLQKRSEILFSLPICPIYGKRAAQAISYLKNVDPSKSFFLVCGDPTSSNANEIASAVHEAYPSIPYALSLKADAALKDKAKGKDIFIASATSVSKEAVEDLASSLS